MPTSRACWILPGVLILVGALTPAAGAGVVLYVDDDAPGDPAPGDNSMSDPVEDGTLAHPFDGIQEAIGVAALSGDTVELAAGTYFEAIDFLGKAVTVRGATGDPADVTIDGNGAFRVVQCGRRGGPKRHGR